VKLKTLLLGVAGVFLVGVALSVYGHRERDAGAKAAKDKADRAHAQELRVTNKVWLDAWPKLRASAVADARAGEASRRRADSLAVLRRAKIAPLPGSPEADWTAYWRNQALDLQLENVELRAAFDDQKRATGKLLAAADTSTGKLAATDSSLGLTLEQLRMKGRFKVPLLGGSLPKPPKWAAATIGCLAGGLAASAVKQDPLKGCAIGGTTTTVVTPTD
jgi:hypothetical protein